MMLREIAPTARQHKIRLFFAVFLFALGVLQAGCSSRRQAARVPAQTPLPLPQNPTAAPLPTASTSPTAPEFTQTGIASWYGAQFDGRRTSDGEIYNMFQYTAAHRTLPFGAVVRVTNLNNGKQIAVRINDRGPFVANRIIDLSYAAAVALGMIGTGTAPVQLQMISGQNPAEGFFGVQVGAFQEESNAERLRRRLASVYTPVTIGTFSSEAGIFYRVRVGRVPSEAAARQLAEQIERQQQLTAQVVRLDN